MNPKEIQNNVRTKTSVAIAAAFALVIALSWNEVIKEIVLTIVDSVGLAGDSIWIRLVAALVTTVICVIGIHIFSKE